MTAPAQNNIRAHAPHINRHERSRLLGASGATLWLTGLSGAGKSTIAFALEAELLRTGVRAYVLDGDNLRLGLNSDLGFAPEHRRENIRRLAEVARLIADSGAIAIVSAVSPYRADRDRARRVHQDDPTGALPFFEVFVDTPIAICEQRDPKGLYRKAREGRLAGLTGIDSPYEPPTSPELVLRFVPGQSDIETHVRACRVLLPDALSANAINSTHQLNRLAWDRPNPRPTNPCPHVP